MAGAPALQVSPSSSHWAWLGLLHCRFLCTFGLHQFALWEFPFIKASA